MTTKLPGYALRHDTRDEIAQALGVPLCEICGARHPPIVPGSVPLMVPADDKQEGIRRIQAHARHELRASPGQLTMTELQHRLGIVDRPTLEAVAEITSRERIAELWLSESVQLIEDAAREDKRPGPLAPEQHAALKQMVHDMVYGCEGMTLMLPLIEKLTKKHEMLSLYVFLRDIAPLIRTTLAEHRPS